MEKKCVTNRDLSTVEEETLIKPKKRFVTYKLRPKQMTRKEKRQMICKKYREKKKNYLKNLENNIEVLEKDLGQSQNTSKVICTNTLKELLSIFAPDDDYIKLFDLAQGSNVDLSSSYEIKIFMERLELKHKSIVNDFLREKDQYIKLKHKKLLLFSVNLSSILKQLFNYYMHIETIDTLTKIK